VPGWTGEYDWTGYIPYEELPAIRNPGNGLVVAANNKIVPDSYPHLLTTHWPAHFRALRITELLESDPEAADGLPLEANRRIQTDIVSLAAPALMERLHDTEPPSERGRNALELLAAWNGAMDRERPEPLLFYAWMRALNRALLADELGPDFESFQKPNAELLIQIFDEGPEWCDDVTTGPTETCAEQRTTALETALDDLAERFDAPLAELRWGEAHRAPFAHPVFSKVPLLGTLLGYPVESDGGTYTVNTGGMRFRDEAPFANLHGPGYRAFYDMAEPEESLYMIATGQSGNPLSAHWGDLVPLWRDGDYLKLDGRGTAQADRLVLTPR
ncbi:MAG TPA: penicillin acylase family protein, partial [Kiloniellales bacterium]|nr:penicillin acylase family protein [Kiloniellales bacterium]